MPRLKLTSDGDATLTLTLRGCYEPEPPRVIALAAGQELTVEYWPGAVLELAAAAAPAPRRPVVASIVLPFPHRARREVIKRVAE